MIVPFLDLARQTRDLRAELSDAVEQVFDSGRFLGGERCPEFERKFADLCGVEHCVGVASGTDAITLALRAGAAVSGHEVITSAMAPPATAAAILAAGAKLVVVDVEPGTLTLDPARLAAAVNEETRAVVPVHLYGQCCDMSAISEVARKHGLLVVEDAAQAHLSRYEGKAPGFRSDAAAFSFYPTKNLGALGDAGAVVSRNPELAERVRLLRSQGEGEQGGVVEAATHSRLDEVQAAVLTAKLPFLGAWTRRRREIAAYYRERLKSSGLECLREAPGRLHPYHLFVIRSTQRARLVEALVRRGVETRIHYPLPIHKHPAYAGLADSLPVCERAATEVLSLPLYPELTDAEVEKVADAAVACGSAD